MKRSIKQISFMMLGVFLVLVIINKNETEKNVLAEEDIATVTVNPNEIINDNFRGVGAEYDPFQFMPESLEGGYNDNWWEVEKRRLDKMDPDIVRVWFQIDWMEAENDNADPHVIDWSNMDINSDKMKAVYKVFDYLQERDIDIILVAGWKMTPEVQEWLGFDGLDKPETSAPSDLDEWAEWVSASLQLLIDQKGYDNIKYVNSYNEPNLGDFETPPDIDQKQYYLEMYQMIHDRLISDGMRNKVQLLGPDESNGLDWMQFATENMDHLLDIYEGHAYGYHYDTLQEWISDRQTFIEPTGKPLMITEFSGTSERTSYQNGVDVADSIISGMRNKVSAMLLWRLYDQHFVAPLSGVDSGIYGSWEWYSNSTVPRYNYYALSLFTRFGGADSEILKTETDDSLLHVSSMRRDDGNYSIFVVNSSKSEDKQVSIDFEEEINKNFRRHVYTDTIERNTNGTIIPSDKEWEGVSTSLTDELLPANSVAVYTTVDQPIQIETNPGDISAALGADIDFEGTMYGDSSAIEWSVIGDSTQGTITANGNYIGPDTLPAMGQTIVKASSMNDSNDYDLSTIRFKVMGLKASSGDNEIELTWDPTYGADYYVVKRSQTLAGPYTVVADDISVETFVDNSVANGQAYYYKVSAVSEYGETNDSSVVDTIPTSNSLSDDFEEATIDGSKWNVINRTFRANVDTGIEAFIDNGQLSLAGTTNHNHWGGKTLESISPFHATEAEHLVVEVDQVSLTGAGTGYRGALGLFYDDRNHIHFSQNFDTFNNHTETGRFWGYNLNAGGSDQVVLKDDTQDEYTMKMVHDGGMLHLFIDNQQLSSVPVNWNSDMKIILSAVAWGDGDEVSAVFDNLSVYTSADFVHAPTNLTAVAGEDSVTLSWDNMDKVESFIVKRRLANSSLPYEVIETGITDTSYNDPSVLNGSEYDYVVAAVVDEEESLHTPSVLAKPE